MERQREQEPNTLRQGSVLCRHRLVGVICPHRHGAAVDLFRTDSADRRSNTEGGKPGKRGDQALSILGYGELDALDAAQRLVLSRPLVRWTGDPVSTHTSRPSSAEKIMAALAATLPSPTFWLFTPCRGHRQCKQLSCVAGVRPGSASLDSYVEPLDAE